MSDIVQKTDGEIATAVLLLRSMRKLGFKIVPMISNRQLTDEYFESCCSLLGAQGYTMDQIERLFETIQSVSSHEEVDLGITSPDITRLVDNI